MRVTLILFVASVLLALPGTSLAQSVQPMRFDLTPAGDRSQQNLLVENNRPYPITVEILAESIAIDDQGEEQLAPADDDFLIFPPQALIEPGRVQSVRVKYIGDPSIEQSRSYRINVNQLAVDLSGEQRSGVQVALNFATLAGVVPPGARPDLSVERVEPVGDGAVRVRILNEGRGYARLFATNWTFTDGERIYQATDDELTAWMQGISSLILPGDARDFVVPVPTGFNAAATGVAVELR